MALVIRVFFISFTWIFLQLFSGWVAYKLPPEVLNRLDRVLRIRWWEKNGKIYQELFRVKTWKDRVPEAGDFFAGGVAKDRLRSSNPSAIRAFYTETLRAEFSHWLPFVLSWSFFLWNSVDIALWMPPVGLIGNLPFLIIQRYNRARVQRLLMARGNPLDDVSLEHEAEH